MLTDSATRMYGTIELPCAGLRELRPVNKRPYQPRPDGYIREKFGRLALILTAWI